MAPDRRVSRADDDGSADHKVVAGDDERAGTPATGSSRRGIAGRHGEDDEEGQQESQEAGLNDADQDPQVPSSPERDGRRRGRPLHCAERGGHRPLPPLPASPLQAMEDVKRAAALKLCRRKRRSVQEVYEKVLSVAGDARRCYDAASAAVAALSDAKFADMMFLDGCFLLWYMSELDDDGGDRLLTGFPWLVLEAIMEFLPVGLHRWVAVYVSGNLIFPRSDSEKKILPASWIRRLLIKCRRVPQDKAADTDNNESSSSISFGDSKLPHLLGLLHLMLIHKMPPHMRKSTLCMHSYRKTIFYKRK
ncbi:hypothetical protein ACP4OV_018573 [Aristida adscensionis]